MVELLKFKGGTVGLGRFTVLVKKANSLYFKDCAVGLEIYQAAANAGTINIISAYNVGIAQEAFAVLGTMKSLRSFSGSGKTINNDGVAALVVAENLCIVSLLEADVDDDIFAHLVQVPKLFTLTLVGCPGVTGRGFPAVTGATNLTTLQVDNCPVEDAMLADLRSASLEELSLVGTLITMAGLNSIDYPKNLPALGQIWVDKQNFSIGEMADFASNHPGIAIGHAGPAQEYNPYQIA